MAGGRGRGGSPTLGRRTFSDGLLVGDNSSTGARNQGSSYVRRIHVSPRVEESMSKVEKTVGVVTPSGVPMEGTPGDRGSFVGAGGP